MTRYVSLTANADDLDSARAAVERLQTAALDLLTVEGLSGVSLSVVTEVDQPSPVEEAATALDDLVTGLMLGGDSAPPGDVIAQAQQRLRAALARQ